MGDEEHNTFVRNLHAALVSYGYHVNEGEPASDEAQSNPFSCERILLTRNPDLYVMMRKDEKFASDFIVECKTIQPGKQEYHLGGRSEAQLAQFARIRPTYLSIYEDCYPLLSPATLEFLKLNGVGILTLSKDGRIHFKRYSDNRILFEPSPDILYREERHSPDQIFLTSNLIGPSIPNWEEVLVFPALGFSLLESKDGETKLHDSDRRFVNEFLPHGYARSEHSCLPSLDGLDGSTFWGILEKVFKKFYSHYPHSYTSWTANFINPDRRMNGFSLPSLRFTAERILDAYTYPNEDNSLYCSNHHSVYFRIACLDHSENVLLQVHIRMHKRHAPNHYDIYNINAITDGMMVDKLFYWSKVHDMSFNKYSTRLPQTLQLSGYPINSLVHDLLNDSEEYIIYAAKKGQSLFVHTLDPDIALAALERSHVRIKKELQSAAYNDVQMTAMIELAPTD